MAVGRVRTVLVRKPARAARERQALLAERADRRRELELQALEGRFTRFMENLPGLAWMKDLEGRYFYVNAAAARAFQRPLEEVYGKTDAELFPPETAAQFRGNDARALESGTGVLAVETLEHDDGVVHHSLVSKFPVPDGDGRVTAVGGMAIDITERIRMEEALRAADRRKDEFVAMLAHELRNPLAPVLAAVEVLRVHGSTEPLPSSQREVIQRQIRQMKRLLDDLLDVSRITRGKIQLSRERLDLTTVLRHAVDAGRPLIEERGHVLHVSFPDVPVEVDADPVRLGQLFTNLLNNAARYTDPAGKIELRLAEEKGSAWVSIRDTGIGMAPDEIAEAFDLFSQGQRGLDRSPGGLGIGLTLVRELAEGHGGSVTARSDGPGQGSEFVVLLPLAGPEARPPAAPHARRPAPVPGGSVLVVDDHRDQAESVGLVLQMAGYEAWVAPDGPSALELAREHRPQVAILDIGLPGMDGYQLARLLRAEPGLDGIVLIALTGYGRQQDREASQQAGFDHHLVKPLEMDELLDVLAEPAKRRA